ncbi:MAG: hypothetical protein LUG12_11525, partial [Erysipelotrichaceae bacterium]|nr:hypothetical protein [Erysipelotrichaceae bacterium]
MSVFINRLLQQKKNSMVVIFIVFICGFFFGFYQYHHTQNIILNYLQNLFYFNIAQYTNQYSLYLYENILLIVICTYLSSSYLGTLGILLILFIKGIQISFSLINILNTLTLSVLIIILLIVEISLEIFFIFILSFHCVHISLYVTYVTFFAKQQLDFKNILNYLLNSLIIVFIILTISLCFRIYFIP